MKFKIRRANLRDLKTVQDLNHRLFLSDSRFDSELFNNWPYSPAGKKYFKRSLKPEPRAGAWAAEVDLIKNAVLPLPGKCLSLKSGK